VVFVVGTLKADYMPQRVIYACMAKRSLPSRNGGQIRSIAGSPEVIELVMYCAYIMIHRYWRQPPMVLVLDYYNIGTVQAAFCSPGFATIEITPDVVSPKISRFFASQEFHPWIN
jgi:hypothetical protein